MVIANRPSKVTLPQESLGWNTVFDFLIERFPLIEQDIWLERLQQGKVHWQSGERIQASSAFIPSKVVYYYRELPTEEKIPFQHHIIYQDNNFLVACKPHFLPVTPGGKYINECLLERLRQQLDLPDIVPMHRLDRETAGLVIFSINQKTRGLYTQLFADHKITKRYQAIAAINESVINPSLGQQWQVTNRLNKGEPTFLMKEVEGKSNASSNISLIEMKNGFGLFELQPITGKTHQLRLHMLKIGMPILNDKFYPQLLAPQRHYENPLQLLAKSLKFSDPISGKQHLFQSERQLICWSN